MKQQTRNSFLILLIPVILLSCNPSISISIQNHYPVLDYKQEVVVIELNQPEPENSEVLGMVKVGDSGFSTNCDYVIVLDRAKLEARKVGGNAIKITRHRSPDIWSSCHRIKAKILRIHN